MQKSEPMENTVIAIFGNRNAGKSSLINSLTGQQTAIVSDVPGTTTDPVRKRIELPGIGICTLVDTAGLDDGGGILGEERVAKSRLAAEQADMAILVFAGGEVPDELADMASHLKEMETPFVIVHNKCDIKRLSAQESCRAASRLASDSAPLEYSCLAETATGRDTLLDSLRSLAERNNNDGERPVFEGLVKSGDTVVLVCPIDSEAPRGRLILPEVQAIREILDRNATAVVLQPSELESYIVSHGKSISMVVTDSQVFPAVDKAVPEEIPLTSFSMLLARSKGAFDAYKEGLLKLDSLNDGDRILMLESCSHHATCEDIGRVKIPAMIRKYSGKTLDFDFVSGLDAIEGDIRRYAMVIQCGGCVVTRRQLLNRISKAVKAGIPVANYGMAIAWMTGIYKRVIKPLL